MHALLERWAEEVVARCLESLPELLRERAVKIPVVFADRPDGGEEEGGLLGLFTGNAVDLEAGSGDAVVTRVELYLSNLWEFSDRSPADFVEEVRITYLHELGHYFGWDEEDIARRGLG